MYIADSPFLRVKNLIFREWINIEAGREAKRIQCNCENSLGRCVLIFFYIQLCDALKFNGSSLRVTRLTLNL